MEFELCLNGKATPQPKSETQMHSDSQSFTPLFELTHTNTQIGLQLTCSVIFQCCG